MRTEEDMDIKVWLTDVESGICSLAIDTLDEYGEIAKKTAEKELFRLKRQGRLPIKRGEHMYQDVVISKSKKKNRVTVGGGKMTGTLWHLVDEGTYRMAATHFIDKILNVLDQKEGER